MRTSYVVSALILVAVIGGVGYKMGETQTAPALTTPAIAAEPAATAPAPAAPAAATATATADNPKIAEVAGQSIMKSDVTQLYDVIKQRAGENAPPLDQVFWMLTDQIIASRLIIKEAQAQHLENTAEVQNAMKMAQEQIVQEAYVKSLFTDLDNETALRTAYDAAIQQYKGQEEVHARHILVDSEEAAKAIIDKLNHGGDFAQIAKEQSKDPGSKDNGGDLGFFAKQAMVPEFAEAAFAMQKGQTSAAPVHTSFGWHVIRVDDRRPMTPPTFEQMKPQILSQMQQEKLVATINGLRAAANVHLIAAPGVPALPAAPDAAPAAPAPAPTPAAAH